MATFLMPRNSICLFKNFACLFFFSIVSSSYLMILIPLFWVIFHTFVYNLYNLLPEALESISILLCMFANFTQGGLVPHLLFNFELIFSRYYLLESSPVWDVIVSFCSGFSFTSVLGPRELPAYNKFLC